MPKPQLKPAGKPLPIHDTYHRKRKLIQLGCFLIFLALPFLNVMRFDIPRQRFYFAGYELWINEFAIIFFSLLFLLYVIAAASMLYGRIYCGYLCPQMIFSEASLKLEERLAKVVNKRFIKLDKQMRQLLSSALFYSVLLLASVLLAFVFIAYFVEPRDLLQRLLRLDIKTVGGVAGAVTTLIAFLDFAFVRTHFCTTICPYGYLQGMFGDKDTLIVEYRDDRHDCIECKKCVRVCHMGIDIRNSPYQIECIHCGECIDACDDILGRLGKPGLIQYTWGEHGELLKNKQSTWRKRLGLHDAKRFGVMLILLFYASGLFVALSMRHNVMVRIAPVRTTMFRLGADGRVYNQFRLTIANRQNKTAEVTFTLRGLPNAQLTLPQPLKLQPAETVQQEFEIAAAENSLPAGVNYFEIATSVSPNNENETFKMTFITPTKKAH
ncbi:MAG: 4Fe-4S binding protein [Acidobacteria bacterium]|nr:4Fe-4S binding protein [Acidobacteriota bacterium]MBI3424720.1 4Fe-4S binding protein [Acidobacteriota bacterium]